MSHHNALFFTVLAVALTASYSLTLPSTIAYERPLAVVAVADSEPSHIPLLAATHNPDIAEPETVAVTEPETEPEKIEEDTEIVNEQDKTEAEPIEVEEEPEPAPRETNTDVATVPFYSQFADISSPSWQKVGCGIASLAMLIDHYGRAESVDSLLTEGINSGAYIDSAGWSHAGLIGLAQKRGLTGKSVTLYEYTLDGAFDHLTDVVADGPVMVSVHYTFEPTNPIPHLAVITGIKDGRVYYNDPAEPTGGNSITAEKFKAAWKKRYIEIRPTT